MGNQIYTIGREFGSGGKDVGVALAEKLGVKCYGKELLAEAAKESGFCTEIFENHDEKPTNSFLYSLVMDTYSFGGYSSAPFLDMPLNHKVFLAQFDTIKKIAEKESCVFIHAKLDYRTDRIAKEMDLTMNKAKDVMQKNDKQRASYYNYYTSKKWGDSRSYDLCLDSSQLGIEGCVEMILAYRKLFDANKKQ